MTRIFVHDMILLIFAPLKITYQFMFGEPHIRTRLTHLAPFFFWDRFGNIEIGFKSGLRFPIKTRVGSGWIWSALPQLYNYKVASKSLTI